jgi:hypothetical protein
MALEATWYEVSPFIYIACGGYMLGRSESILLTLSAVLLLTAGGTIMMLRRKFALKELGRLRLLETGRPANNVSPEAPSRLSAVRHGGS